MPREETPMARSLPFAMPAIRSTALAALSAPALALSLAGQPAARAEPLRLTLDPAHTHILFKVNHLGLSNTVGQFDRFEGTVVLDPEAPEDSSVSVTIEAASIDTNNDARDSHLRGDDFFDTGTHPVITFESLRVDPTSDQSATVYGMLTLRGESRPVALRTRLNYLGEHPLPGRSGMVAGFTANATIDRTDFGMDAYAGAVGNEVVLLINTEAVAP
ncbi:hypothetical protein CCR85_11095 [Rhodothalassium salexigens]|nr:hypothetical protein [Rhodothalassium salexigens]